MVLGAYLGARYSTGGGCLVYPVSVDSTGVREVIQGHTFRVRDQSPWYDVNVLFVLLAGAYVDPRSGEQALPPPPVHDPERSVKRPLEVAGGEGGEVAGEEGDGEPMDLDMILDRVIQHAQNEAMNEFLAGTSRCDEVVCGVEAEGQGSSISVQFGGNQIDVQIAEGVCDELTGHPIVHDQVVEGIRTEMVQLETLEVGDTYPEKKGRTIAVEHEVQILTARWVFTQKTAILCRARLVVRDYASGAESAFRSGIYAPTSSLDSLRVVLAFSVVESVCLLTADVSTAFMYAPVEADACDLVLLPANITVKGQRVILWLKKAMNGLRRAPLLWFLELQRTIRDLGGDETFESTLFRVKTDTQFLLVLVYVDDLLIASNDVEGGENFLRALQKIWKIKRTGSIPSGKKGHLEFLGRTIYRLHGGEECLYFGVSRSYMGIFVSWEEKLKESTGSAMPKLEELLKDAEKKFGTSELSATEAQRYRRVLGQLAWAALSRADLAFPVGFLSRFQSKPHVPAEVCLRSFLRWLKGHLHFVQQTPASSPPVLTEEGVVVGFCDASWNVTSVSGAVISWRGCCLKCFSRRQEVPALLSAEAEAIAITEASKELVALGMLIETARDGIPLDEIGVPAKTTGSMKLRLYNDGKAAISISTMEGLLRRVKRVELRAHYVKYLHRRRRLTLEHWEGVSNPSDGLTKSCKLIEMWLNLCNAVGLVPGLDEDKAALLRGLSRDGDDDELPTDERSVREGEYAHRACFLHFSPRWCSER